MFNATYQQQAEVDARLTNGADVTVTESPGAQRRAARRRAGRDGPASRSVEPLQHRFAYVGADLQDLYGVRPATIAGAGKLQDAWFAGGTRRGLMHELAQQPDGVLVAAETVSDFQLRPATCCACACRTARTGSFTTVPFHYAGVAKEFPTAPTDSFFVANADYVARATGSDAVGTFLVQTDGTSPAAVASACARGSGPSARSPTSRPSARSSGPT